MRLRLYHHRDGARVAYREYGTGPPLALLHSALLSHMEFEPLVEHLGDRFRLVLPDLPLHGDSEARTRHPYTLEWFSEVIAGFCAEVLGPRPLVGGHGAGAEILLRAVAGGRLQPSRMVLMPNRMHAPADPPAAATGWQAITSAAAVPGLDGLLSYGAGVLFRPEWGVRLSSRANPAGGRPAAPRLRRRPRQLRASPARGPSAPATGPGAPRGSCWTCIRGCRCRCCCCGPTRTASIRWPRPKRRCRCSTAASCVCSRAPAS